MRKKTSVFPLILTLLAISCSNTSSQQGTDTIDGQNDLPQCTVLFGNPAKNTGLTREQCKPECACKDLVFTPPEYTQQDIDFIRSRQLKNPPVDLDQDPYKHPWDHVTDRSGVCGVLVDRDDPVFYTLKTFSSVDQAKSAGAIITHYGACGLCSSLKDLAVYMEKTDLSGPVRQCAIQGVVKGMDVAVKCLMDIGFSKPCAEIWYYDSKNTSENCKVCFKMLNAKYQHPDGSLNECIQCDEDKSGPVFKDLAGRTRRDSGLPSALCRPCSSVAPVTHKYREIWGKN